MTAVNTGVDTSNVFKLYTEDSWTRLVENEKDHNISRVKKPLLHTDGKLIDGEIQFDDEDEEAKERDRDLKEGKVLADSKFGPIPPEIIGKPIEEIDQRIKDKTFVIINTRFKENFIYRFSATNAFFIFGPINPIRRFSLYIVTNSFFDYFIMLTILVNSAFLTLATEYPAAEYTFLSIYTVEMLLKLMARGLVLERHTYMRDPWNILDVLIVIISYAMLIVQFVSGPTNVNIKSLRTFRVFRVLKTFSIIPGLKSIIGALLKSMRMFIEVLLLILFCISIFALIGVQSYKGILRNKCVLSVDWTPVDMSVANQSNIDAYYNWFFKQPENWMSDGNGGFMLCGNASGAGTCNNAQNAQNQSWMCLSNVANSMNYGLSSYDNFGWALMESWQLLHLDNWEDLYNAILRTSGPANVVFFIILVFLGSFYLINLMVAVVTTGYGDQVVKSEKEKIENKRALKLQKIKEKQQRESLENKKRPKKKRLKVENKSSKKRKSSKNNEKHETFIENEHTESGRTNMVEMSIKDHASKENIRKTSISIVKSDVDSGFNSQDLEDTNSLNKAKSTNEDTKVIVISDGQELTDRNCYCCSQCCQSYIIWLKIQNTVFAFVNDPLFELFIIISILINTIIMATDHYPITKTWDILLDLSNTIFTAIFILEAILKLISLGKEYFSSGWNIFDFVVVLANILDMSVQQVNGLSILRVFRMFRVFKLARSWKAMGDLLNVIFNSLSSLGNVSLLLFIVLFIFAVIGMQLFRGTYTAAAFGNSTAAIPRWNYEDFVHALLMEFRILCGEFTQPLRECMVVNGAICMAVIYPSLILGRCMVLNLFLALLLSSFGSKEQVEEEKSKLAEIVDRLRNLLKLNNQVDDSKTIKDIENSNEKNETSSNAEDAKSIDNDEDVKELMLEDCLCHLCFKSFHEGHCCFCITCPVDQKYGEKWQIFRYELLKLSENSVFEGFILFLIIASSISLCFNDIYLNNFTTLNQVLNYLNIIFAILFTLEMIIKMVAFGLRIYFTSFWTILDFFIVWISWIDVIITLALPNANSISAFRSLRTLRAFRPLRSISRWKGMKITVNALLYSIPSIANVLMVCLLIWIIFSIIGVQFFKGKFYYCQDSNQIDVSYLIAPNKSECYRLGYYWNNRNENFDNVGQGLLALYQVATFEGWLGIVQSGVDSTDIDLQPIRDNSMGYYAYFVIFIIIGSFFILNLFIGVIINTFNDLKKKYEGDYMEMFLTPSQKKYYYTMKKLNHQKPQKTIRKPDNKFQRFFFDVSISEKFELSIIVLILFNMFGMMIEHYNQRDIYTQALEIINTIFTTIFALEAIVKLIGLRWHYFRQVWNNFDFIITLLNIIGLIVKELTGNSIVTATLLRVVRLFRISRLLRLIKFAKGLRKLLFTLIISLPALLNIGALLALIIFIYAIIGMSLFGNVVHNNAIDDLVNFETFEHSMLVLFRISTVAGWNDIFDGLLVNPPYCNDSYIFQSGQAVQQSNGNCGNSGTAIFFCTTFILLTFLIIVNMYVAIIIENFSLAHEQEEVGIVEDDFEGFYIVWEKYDPYATQYIKFEELSDFVADLSEPLGLPKPNTIAIISFDLPILDGDKVHCLDILISLVRRILGDVQESEQFKEVKKQIDASYQQAFPNRLDHNVITTTLRRKKEDAAAIMLQRAWRYHKAHLIFNKMRENLTILAGKETAFKSGGPTLQNFGSTISLRQVRQSLNKNKLQSSDVKPPPMTLSFYN